MEMVRFFLFFPWDNGKDDKYGGKTHLLASFYFLTERVFFGDGADVLHGNHSGPDVNEKLIHKVFVFSLTETLSEDPRTLFKHLF